MTNETNVYIIGAGAIGKALAVFLSSSHRQVTLVRGSVDHLDTHSENITVHQADGSTMAATIRVSSLSVIEKLDGLVVLTSKSFGNNDLAQRMQPKIGSAPLVVLQNGLDVEKPFLQSDYEHIYRCVLFTTCQTIEHGAVRYKPVDVSPIGTIAGDEQTLNAVVSSLHTPYFQFRAENTIQPIIWTKAIVNCVFNSICPLLETDNGIFYRNETALHIADRIIAECIGVASAKGIALESGKIKATLLRISKLSDGQLISTYQDIKNGRRTEIETLNAAIANSARELQKSGQVVETRLLGELIKLKEDLHIKV